MFSKLKWNHWTFACAVAAIALLPALGYQNLQHANAVCANYSSTSNTITVSCDTTIPQIASEVNNGDVIKSLGNGHWLLNAILQVNDGAKLTISSPDVAWLKIAGSNSGIVIFGNFEVTNSNITSWDVSKGAPIPQTSSGSTERAYINLRGSEGGTINGSEIAYLGYKAASKTGIDLFGNGSSHNITITGNSKIHDNWRGFDTNKAFDIVIENSKFYNNIDSAINLHSGTHDVKVTNVQAPDNEGDSITCDGECTNVILEGKKVGGGT